MEETVYERVRSSNNNHWWFKSRVLIFETIIKDLITKKKIEILDYGCGIGSNINMLRKYGTVDVCETHLKTREYIKKKFNASIVKKIKKNYDLIFLTDVIEHIKNDKEKIKKLIKHLKKNGLLFITVPAYQSLFSSKDVTLHHYRRYNKYSLKKIFPHKEIKIIKLSYFNFFLFPPIVLIIIFFKIFKIKFIDRVEKAPIPLILLCSKFFLLKDFY